MQRILRNLEETIYFYSINNNQTHDVKTNTYLRSIALRNNYVGNIRSKASSQKLAQFLGHCQSDITVTSILEMFFEVPLLNQRQQHREVVDSAKKIKLINQDRMRREEKRRNSLSEFASVFALRV